MARKDQTEKNREKVKAVIELLKKQAPLTVRQEKFCNYACVGLFLKAKGDNVKKAAKHLRACLSWRDSIGIEYLIADEFSAELAEGFAYIAGHDNESRPVVIFRIKQDYQKFNSQKLFMRLLVFTLEVAIGTMPKNVEQFVLLFDASFYRSASAYMNFLLASLKIVSEYYPGRLHKAFIIDPPSLFSYLWKGVRPFVDLSTVTMVVSSLDYEESEDDDFSSYPRASSLRFDPSSIPSTGKISSSCSTRFAFTVSQHSDSLKPWYLSLKDTSASSTSTASSPSASLVGPAISPLNARSFSFASPAARTPRCSTPGPTRKKTNQCFTSTPLPQRVSNNNGNPRTPKPSFLQSPAMFFRKDKDCHVVSRTEKSRESFLPFLRFYRRPYDEMDYRSKMKPPLGGLISIVSPHIKNRHHMSQSQRF